MVLFSLVCSCWQDGEPLYWRKEKVTFRDFEVEVSSTEITPVFITRTMLVRHVKVTSELDYMTATFSYLPILCINFTRRFGFMCLLNENNSVNSEKIVSRWNISSS